jgi:hypothetical protein
MKDNVKLDVTGIMGENWNKYKWVRIISNVGPL